MQATTNKTSPDTAVS